MVRPREILWRLLAAFRGRRLDLDTQAELQAHLDMEIEAGQRRGLTRLEAERAAHLRAGSIAQAMERVRDQRRLGPLDLGATRTHIISGVLRDGMLLGLAGIGCGLLLAPAAGRTLSSLLYGISETDCFSLLLTPLLLLVASLLACTVPAWRASRTEPLSVLRDQ